MMKKMKIRILNYNNLLHQYNRMKQINKKEKKDLLLNLKTGQSTKGNGVMILEMGKENKHGLKIIFI